MKGHSDYQGIFNAVQVPLLVVDRDLRIVDANEAAQRTFGENGEEIRGCPCHKVMHGSDRPCHEAGVRCPVREAFATEQPVREVHQHKREDGGLAWEEVLVSPLLDAFGRVTLVVEELRDLTETLQHVQLIRELRAQVRTLEGLLPICSHCKRIRSPEGTWEEVECYMRARAVVDFTHGICPDCVARYYPAMPPSGG